MFAVNSRDAGFADAIGKTFDGKHPCPLCLAVDAGKQKEKEEQQKQLVDSTNKVNAVPALAIELPPRAESAIVYFVDSDSPDTLSIRPPSPPPWRA